MFENGNAHNQRRAGGIPIHPLPLSAGLHGEGFTVPSEGTAVQEAACPSFVLARKAQSRFSHITSLVNLSSAPLINVLHDLGGAQHALLSNFMEGY